MAPPPPASMPLQQRLLQLVQTLQFAWFIGHLTLLFCASRYFLSYITFNYYSRWAQFSYRTAFVAAAATYGIVVFKAFRARQKQGRAQGQGNAIALAADENVQYLAMAIVWLFSRQIPLAVMPFAVYSIFHVATYTRANLLPTLQPPQQSNTQGAKPQASSLSDAIGRFVKDYYDASMTLVAILEISLWFRLAFSAMLFQKGSWILFAVYTVFFRARYSQSSFVQGAVSQLTARADAMVANQSTPPAIRNAWDTLKGLVRQAADVTDVNRYVGGAQRQQQGPKKAQ